MKKRSLAPQRGFFPQPSYLIGTYKDDGTPNFALITFITFCSVNPPMLMFVSRGTKLTRELVEKNKVFSANLVTTNMMYMADYFVYKSTGDGFIYIGKIKNIQVDDEIMDTSYGKIDMLSIDPLIYAPGHYYRLSSEVGTVGYSKKKSK